ncbi:MAG TPA: general secretion pathway protein GspJ, partial [Thiolinea sp.]|nr:general secretion pathway protein GspJ [Thiolinea sp.]
SSFHTMGQGWDAADRKLLKTEDTRLISEFLRNQLSQAIVVQIKGDKGPVYAFEGNDHYVRYAAPLQPLQNQGGIYLIELSVNIDSDGRKIEMRYAPYRPDMSWDEALKEVKPVLVYSGLGVVHFDYYAAESDQDDPRWESEWMNKPVYPLLMRVMIQGKDQKPWPALVVDLPQVDEYVGAS